MNGQSVGKVLAGESRWAKLFGALVLAATVMLGASVAPTGTHAQEQPRELGTFGDWRAFTHGSGNGKVCFAISTPTAQEMNPAGRRRGPGFFFVTTRPADNVREEVSAAYGYPLANGTTRAVVGDETFSLLVRDQSAWIENAAEQPRLVDAMRRGSNMRVYGQSTRGTQTIDTYSLSGITAALNSIAQECN